MKASNSNAWDPEFYRKHARQPERGLAFIPSLPLRGDERILDIGCGDGQVTAALAQQVPQGSVVGLDISERMIVGAQKNYADIKNLSFVCHDIATFSAQEKCDVIVSFNTFHWVEEQQKAFANVYHLLKNGGRFFMIMSARDDQSSTAQVFASDRWKAYIRQQKETYFGRTAEEMKVLLEQAGFQDYSVQCESLETTFTSQEEFLNKQLTWVPYATGLTGQEVREFAKDIVDRTVALHDGRVVSVTKHLFVQAVRKD